MRDKFVEEPNLNEDIQIQRCIKLWLEVLKGEDIEFKFKEALLCRRRLTY